MVIAIVAADEFVKVSKPVVIGNVAAFEDTVAAVFACFTPLIFTVVVALPDDVVSPVRFAFVVTVAALPVQAAALVAVAALPVQAAALVAVAALPPIERLATAVVEDTTNGAVPVVIVDVICPETDKDDKDKAVGMTP